MSRFTLNISFLFSLFCFSCGGGSPAPVQHVNPVESFTEAELLSAGVPALPTDSAAASEVNQSQQRGSRITSNMDFRGFREEGEDRLALWPEEIPGRRVIGWAMFRSQQENEENSLTLAMQLASSGSSQYRLFYAIGNYSTGRWEIGDRIIIDLASAGFSLGNSYVSPQGNTYILIVVGHPGSSNLPTMPLILNQPLVRRAGPRVEGAGWTAEISRPDPGKVLFHVNSVESEARAFRMDFGRESIGSGLVPVFPAESKLTSFKGSDEELQALWESGIPSFIHGVHDADHPPLWQGTSHIGFFNLNEINGVRNPYTIRGWSEGDWTGDGFALNTWEVPVAQGSKSVEFNGILLGEGTGNDRVVAAGGTLVVADMQGTQLGQVTTDSQGRFSFNVSQQGEYILGWSWGEVQEFHKVTVELIDSDGSQVGVLARFNFEEFNQQP